MKATLALRAASATVPRPATCRKARSCINRPSVTCRSGNGAAATDLRQVRELAAVAAVSPLRLVCFQCSLLLVLLGAAAACSADQLYCQAGRCYTASCNFCLPCCKTAPLLPAAAAAMSLAACCEQPAAGLAAGFGGADAAAGPERGGDQRRAAGAGGGRGASTDGRFPGAAAGQGRDRRGSGGAGQGHAHTRRASAHRL